MSLLFDGQNHEYWLDGFLLPSMTQLLRDAGLVRFDGIPAFILEAARRRGWAVHALCHYANDSDLDESSVDDAYRGYLEAWLRCKAERGIVPLLCEHRIASRRHRVAGTIDLLCEIEGDGWLLDYASGDPVACCKQLQTAGYLGVAMEWAAEDSVLAAALQRCQRWRRASIRLRKNGVFQFREYVDPRDYSRIQVLAAAWHIREQFGATMQPEELIA